MQTEADFLRQLLADPSDDGTRLVYADWLDERGDPSSAARAEFLRLTADVKGQKRDKRKRTRLQQLAAALETDWLAVVSRLAVENCQGQRRRAEPPSSRQIHWRYLCNRRWEDLRTTGDPNVRVCEGCQENVHYCDTIGEARTHAWDGHCIAVDLGVLRRDRDLEPQAMLVGRPSPQTLRREHERMQPDAVSAQRERRKQRARLGEEAATRYEELLRQHDDPVHWESPPDFDYPAAEARFRAFADALSAVLGIRLEVETGSRIQDATFHSQLAVPLGHGRQAVLRSSNFGDLAGFHEHEEVPASTVAAVQSLLEQHGYVYVPSAMLAQPYTGANPGVTGTIRTWWNRYFDWV